MRGESFTDRMRSEAPTGWMELDELCANAGVDAGVLFYNSQFGDAMEKMYDLGILKHRFVEGQRAFDEAPESIEIVELLHPNLWEEVVGTLRYTEALCRLHKPEVVPIEIKSAAEFAEVFGGGPAQRDYLTASGQVDTNRLT